MDAATCSTCATNVRESGLGLYSYLSSGKSSAIAINFLLISSQPFSTACEGLATGFGGSVFLGASWASAGSAAHPAASTAAAIKHSLFMISLLSFVRRSGRLLTQTRGSARRFHELGLLGRALRGGY